MKGKPPAPRMRLVEMTDAQQAAYWKTQARKHESRLRDLRARLARAGLAITPTATPTKEKP